MQLKKYLVLASIGIVVVVGFIWTSNHSFITIENQTPGTTTYTVTSAAGTETFTSSKQSIRRLVTRGNYQITAQQSQQNAVHFVRSGGFLMTKKISLDLKSEANRTFIGNNPNPCMFFNGKLLLSGECGAGIETYQAHIPATTSQPTYTQQLTPPTINSTTEGFINTAAGNFALIRNLSEGNYIYQQLLYRLNDDLTLAQPRNLTDLSSSGTYGMAPYGTGFVIYDTTYNNVFYYPSATSSATKLSIKKPSDPKVSPYNLSVARDTVTVMYAPGGANYAVDGDDGSSNYTQGSTTVSVTKGDSQNVYVFGKKYARVIACATNTLCAQGENKLDVYTTNGTNAAFEYTVPNVSDITVTSNAVLLSVDSGIESFDPATGSGYLSYSYGSYKYCGLQPTADGYVLCLISPQSNKVALHIQTAIDDATNQIDKKLLTVAKDQSINTISAYGSYIYITPNYGAQRYVAALKIFDYDQNTITTENQKARALIQSSGIDTTKYTVITSR